MRKQVYHLKSVVSHIGSWDRSRAYKHRGSSYYMESTELEAKNKRDNSRECEEDKRESRDSIREGFIYEAGIYERRYSNSIIG
ncbi:conjugative transfer TraA domain protein [Rickettsia endosymbiont of Ixodes pacificus]|nr:conjugative transfer TraA domain protein [Rickettsia endosymbiont of Ixodes pacificus]